MVKHQCRLFSVIMQDVESYGIVSAEKKSTMLKDRIIAYLAVLLTLLSFIFSCIGLNMGRQSSLEKTLYTFSFPYFNQVPKVETGMVVSLDENGYVFTGAGTTISLNVTVAPAYSFNDIRVCAFTNNIIFAGSKGQLVAYEISYDDISIENGVHPLRTLDSGESRKVESLYKMNNDTLVVAGSGELLPIKVQVIIVDAHNYKITFEEGTPFSFTTNADKSFSYCDELHDWDHIDSSIMMACTWEEGNDLHTMVAKLSPDSKSFTKVDDTIYGETRQFHGLAGCGLNGYVVATVGPMRNESQHIDVGPIRVAYVEIDRNSKLRVSPFKEVFFEWSVGFFSIDNVGPNGAVMCYTRAASGGINCMSMDVTHGPHGGVQFGSTVVVSKGGSAIDVQRTKMQVINRRTFAVMWADQNVGGALSYQMVTFNNAGDMSVNGPAFVISQRHRHQQVHQHIVGCSGVDDYKSFIVELVQTDREASAYLHTVYVYPRPIGIAAKTFAGGNQVQFGGLWKVSKKALSAIRSGKLRPGSMYYTNDRGMILEGPPAGYAHRTFGIDYIQSRSDESLLSLSNQVGMAISETELLLKFY